MKLSKLAATAATEGANVKVKGSITKSNAQNPLNSWRNFLAPFPKIWQLPLQRRVRYLLHIQK